jgi:hypothetical protein
MSFLNDKKAGSLFDDKAASKGLFGNSGAKGGLFGDDADEEGDPYGDLPAEQYSERILSEAEAAFKARAQAEQERFELATDSEYWMAVCFQSRRQKEQFLAALREKFGMGGDSEADKYIDGWEFAKALGIVLERENVPYNTSSKLDKKWLDLSR